MTGLLSLEKLRAYQYAHKLSQIGWEIYNSLAWQDRKTMGDQFLRATDSNGANITEGFGRFHYLDKVKFYYNARGSLLESRYWLELLAERGKVSEELNKRYLDVYKLLRPTLNGLIESTMKTQKQSLNGNPNY